ELVELHLPGLRREQRGGETDRESADSRQLPPRVAAFELASYHLGPIALIEHVFYLRNADDARVVRVPDRAGQLDERRDLVRRERTHAHRLVRLSRHSSFGSPPAAGS